MDPSQADKSPPVSSVGDSHPPSRLADGQADSGLRDQIAVYRERLRSAQEELKNRSRGSWEMPTRTSAAAPSSPPTVRQAQTRLDLLEDLTTDGWQWHHGSRASTSRSFTGSSRAGASARAPMSAEPSVGPTAQPISWASQTGFPGPAPIDVPAFGDAHLSRAGGVEPRALTGSRSGASPSQEPIGTVLLEREIAQLRQQLLDLNKDRSDQASLPSTVPHHSSESSKQYVSEEPSSDALQDLSDRLGHTRQLWTTREAELLRAVQVAQNGLREALQLNDQLSSKVSHLHMQLEEARKENGRLSERVAQTPDLQSQISKLEAELSAAKVQIDLLKSKVASSQHVSHEPRTIPFASRPAKEHDRPATDRGRGGRDSDVLRQAERRVPSSRHNSSRRIRSHRTRSRYTSPASRRRHSVHADSRSSRQQRSAPRQPAHHSGRASGAGVTLGHRRSPSRSDSRERLSKSHFASSDDISLPRAVRHVHLHDHGSDTSETTTSNDSIVGRHDFGQDRASVVDSPASLSRTLQEAQHWKAEATFQFRALESQLKRSTANEHSAAVQAAELAARLARERELHEQFARARRSILADNTSAGLGVSVMSPLIRQAQSGVANHSRLGPSPPSATLPMPTSFSGLSGGPGSQPLPVGLSGLTLGGLSPGKSVGPMEGLSRGARVANLITRAQDDGAPPSTPLVGTASGGVFLWPPSQR